MSAAITSTNVLAVTPAPASTPAGSASTNKGAFADLMKQVLATTLPGAGKDAQQQDGQGTPKNAKADPAAATIVDGAAPAAPAAAPVLPVAVVDGTFALAAAMSAPAAGIVVAAAAAAVEPADARTDTRLPSAPVDGAAAVAKAVATVALGQTVSTTEPVVAAQAAAQSPAPAVGRHGAQKPGAAAATAPAAPPATSAASSAAVATAAATPTAADPAATKAAGPSPAMPTAQPHAAKEPLAPQSAPPAPAQVPSATPAATTPAPVNGKLETAPVAEIAQTVAPTEAASAGSAATSTAAQGPTVAATTVPAAAPAMPATFAPLATAQTSAPTAQAPVPATFTTQVTKQVFTLATTAAPGEHVMVLKVTPENLGPVTVQAHITGTSVRIELFAPTDAGRDAIRQVMPDLKRDIASSGLQTQLDLSSGNHPGAQQGDTGRNAFNQRGFAPNPGTPSSRQLVVDTSSSTPRPGLSGTDAVLDVMA